MSEQSHPQEREEVLLFQSELTRVIGLIIQWCEIDAAAANRPQRGWLGPDGWEQRLTIAKQALEIARESEAARATAEQERDVLRAEMRAGWKLAEVRTQDAKDLLARAEHAEAEREAWKEAYEVSDHGQEQIAWQAERQRTIAKVEALEAERDQARNELARMVSQSPSTTSRTASPCEPESLRVQAAVAADIAHVMHAGATSRYDDQPYIEHVSRVAARVDGDKAKAVAFLHDVVEDTTMTFADLRACGFSDDVIEAVRLLTRDEDCREYPPYLQRLVDSRNALAITVKLADLADNLRPPCPDRLRAIYEAARELLLPVASELGCSIAEAERDRLKAEKGQP